jgi:hypothetical protein
MPSPGINVTVYLDPYLVGYNHNSEPQTPLCIVVLDVGYIYLEDIALDSGKGPADLSGGGCWRASQQALIRVSSLKRIQLAAARILLGWQQRN